MTNSNAVVDAFNCRNLVEMADIAAALGKEMDEVSYRGQARLAREKFLSDYLDAETGIFVDSVEVRHSSLHANAIALAFSLVPTGRVDNIVAFLERKGMACSVYFAQYLLEAFCAAGRADLAVRLMASSGNRSWRGMMDFGSTITMEAWNVEVKPNLDINHAWGAAPVNIIARYLLGVTPIEAGYRKISVRPQLGGLKRIKGAVPTVQGRVLVDATESSLHVSVPSSARVLWKGRVQEVEAGEYDFK